MMSAEFGIGPNDLLESPANVLEHLWKIAWARWEERMAERARREAVAKSGEEGTVPENSPQRMRMRAQLKASGY